jgi:catechol 2,3-dioxygenase
MNPTPSFDVVRTAHIEYNVIDLERSRRFYIETLGMIETESTGKQIYLRGVEDRFHHCLVLTESPTPSVGHISFRMRTETDLDLLAQMLQKRGLQFEWMKSSSSLEKGQGRALRFRDPLGFPVEFFHEMEESEWLWQSFDRHLGAKIMRLDHVNLFVDDVQNGSDWYVKDLGFQCTEYTETDDEFPKLWATWLKRKPTVHDVALMNGAGPRVHHAGFYVPDQSAILRTADLLASKGYLKSIERGPGRHGISNAFFLYLRDPDGHRIELYTGDYLSADPDWKPIRWKLNDPQRQTFWGAPAPDSWFKEASEVSTSSERVASKQLLN